MGRRTDRCPAYVLFLTDPSDSSLSQSSPVSQEQLTSAALLADASNIIQDGHKVGEKNSPCFPGFSRAMNLLFYTLSQQKVNNDLHQGSFHINSSNITGYHRTLTSSLFLMILFTQSTAALHKYLNDKLKILYLLQCFPEVAQNSLCFPCSEKSLSTPGFPGLWPPC